MKKVISLVIAFVMLFAVCVPAFADIEIKQDSPDQTGKTEVRTNIDKVTEGYTYTVSIPADVQIDWNDTAEKEVNYTVTSQLLLGDQLTVAVAPDNAGAMKAVGTDKTLTFALNHGEAATFYEVNDEASPETKPTVQIASFAGVPIAEYVGTMTFTVTYHSRITA